MFELLTLTVYTEMKDCRFKIIAILACMGVLVLQQTSVLAEAVRPSQARVWDALSRQAYLSGEDADWDGINDDEERLGKILWGAVTGDDAIWCAANGAETEVGAWTASAIDDDVQSIALPFEFPLGTQSWEQAWIGVNGTLGFGSGQLPPPAQPLPALAFESDYLLGIFWDDLYLEPTAGGRVWTLSPGVGRFVVCWEHLQLAGQAGSSISFQVELREDGELFLRYRELKTAGADVTNGVVGIQADGLGWWFPSAMLQPDSTLVVVSIDGLDPNHPDSDGDGIIDGIELFYYRPRFPGGPRLSPVAADNPGDIDRDGLDVEQEYLHGQLDPFYWDTDGDMLSDGYEVSTRLLANSADGIHGMFGDADVDGLSNYEERLHRSQPRLADSDGDGRSDADEVALGFNPIGPGGVPFPAWLAPVKLTLGDPGLDGKTEAYEMTIDSISGDMRGFTFQNTAYGVVQAQTLQLAIGGRYRLGLRHLGSVRSSEGMIDLDYKAGVAGVDGTVVSVTDSTGLLGQHVSSSLLAPGTEPIDTNRFAEVWVHYRVLPDGSVPVADPVFTPRLSAWAAGRAAGAGPVRAEELADPGVLVLPDYLAAMGLVSPAKIRVHGLEDAPGCTRWLRFSNPSQVTYQLPGMWAPAVPGSYDIQIPGPVTADTEVELRSNGLWPIGATVSAECVVKDASGYAVLARKGVRLIGQVIVTLGDSLTYGYRRRSDGTHETPDWANPWLVYPSHAAWGLSGAWLDLSYQGPRGYLMRDLTPSVPWAGHPANGHGPDHCGYAGATTTHILSMLGDAARLYPNAAIQAGPSDLVLVYFIGMNDIIASRRASAVYSYWVQGINSILSKRSGHGRTLIVGVTLPPMRSHYTGYTSERQSQLIALNKKIRAHQLSGPHTKYARYVVAEAENVSHDSGDDGLHFFGGGYESIEQAIRLAILNGLKQ